MIEHFPDGARRTPNAPSERMVPLSDRTRHVVIVATDQPLWLALVNALAPERGGSRIERFASLPDALERIRDGAIDALLIDLAETDDDAIASLAKLSAEIPRLAIIALTAEVDDEGLDRARRLGACEVLPTDLLGAGSAARRLLSRAIDQRRQAVDLARLREQVALWEQGCADGLWEWDIASQALTLSPRLLGMLGRPENGPLTGPTAWTAVVADVDQGTFDRELQRHLRGESAFFELQHRFAGMDGEQRWALTRGVVARDSEGRPRRMAGSLTDITDRKNVEANLIHDAFHDTMTGLPNRNLFLSRLSREIDRLRQFPDMQFAVMSLDCDQFKLVNEGMSRNHGDRLLVELSRRLAACIRPGDMLARVGGDAFAILLAGVRGVGDSFRVAHRIHAEMQAPIVVDGRKLFFSFSVGIRTSTSGQVAAEDFLRDAETAMYRAKASGKGQLVVFDRAMHAAATARLQLETELHQALVHDQFEVHFQPIYSLISGRILGCEALVRWNRPGRGLLLPGSFIPVAEETGLIVPIGRYVLEKACRTAARWTRDPLPWVSVNISSRELTDETVNFIDRLYHEVKRENPSFALHLEITESVLLDDSGQTLALLHRLNEMGVRLAIDDFGTGYSSLSYLRQLPVEFLKIDGSFVRGIAPGHYNTEIVRTILQLGRNLGLEVVAEGLETPDQLEQLHALGCEYAQGHLFSMAVDSDAMEALLATDTCWSLAGPDRLEDLDDSADF